MKRGIHDYLYIFVRVNEANYMYLHIYSNLRSNVLCLCFDILNKNENKLYIIVRQQRCAYSRAVELENVCLSHIPDPQ